MRLLKRHTRGRGEVCVSVPSPLASNRDAGHVPFPTSPGQEHGNLPLLGTVETLSPVTPVRVGETESGPRTTVGVSPGETPF